MGTNNDNSFLRGNHQQHTQHPQNHQYQQNQYQHQHHHHQNGHVNNGQHQHHRNRSRNGNQNHNRHNRQDRQFHQNRQQQQQQQQQQQHYDRNVNKEVGNPTIRSPKRFEDKASTSLVNGIKLGVLANQLENSPLGSPRHIGSPVMREIANLWPEDSWPPNYNIQSLPREVPTLHGQPFWGAPMSCPSPVGSSRSTTNSTPPQDNSTGSSPMASSYFANTMMHNRRSSDEELAYIPHNGRRTSARDIPARLSSSQSPIQPSSYMYNPMYGGSSPDDIHSYSPAPSRSSEDLSLDNLIAAYKELNTDNAAISKRLSPSASRSASASASVSVSASASASASATASPSSPSGCSECTADQVCDTCGGMYRNNILLNILDGPESVPSVSYSASPIRNHAVPTASATFLQDAASALRKFDAFSSRMDADYRSVRADHRMPELSDMSGVVGPVSQQQKQQQKPQQQQQQFPKTVLGPLAEKLGAASFTPTGNLMPGAASAITGEDQPLASSSPLIFHNQRMANQQPLLYCNIHKGAQRFYCITCSKLFCTECGPQHHVGHLTEHLIDAANNAQSLAEQVISDCRVGMSTIRDDIDKGMLASQTLDTKVCEAINNVRAIMRRLTEALLARERELLDNIDSTRKNKQSALKKRDDGLKYALTRLRETSDKLELAIQAMSLSRSPLDLIIAKDTALAQVFNIQNMRNGLPVLDDYSVKFNFTDHHLLEMVRNLGSISTGNGHVGDRRFLNRPTMPPMAPPMMIPGARAIATLNFRVSVTNNRRAVNGNPYIDIGKSVRQIGSNDPNSDERLCRPWGVVCDREGNILIVDRSNNRIMIYRTDGAFVRSFGTHGTGRCQFDRPAGIAIDARRRVVIADKDNHRIQVVTMEGEFIMSFGEKGTNPGQFNYPWDVACNDACQIVVSDTRNHRVQLFSPEGVYLRKFGFDNTVLFKCFDSPRGVVFNNEGNVIVTDFNNHRIVVIDADFLSARFLGHDSLTPHPMPAKTFLRPQGVAIDDNGHVIVSDSRNHRVQILDSNGVCRWRFGTFGTGLDEMDRPSGIAVTPEGRIVVVDFGNARVLMY